MATRFANLPVEADRASGKWKQDPITNCHILISGEYWIGGQSYSVVDGKTVERQQPIIRVDRDKQELLLKLVQDRRALSDRVIITAMEAAGKDVSFIRSRQLANGAKLTDAERASMVEVPDMFSAGVVAAARKTYEELNGPI